MHKSIEREYHSAGLLDKQEGNEIFKFDLIQYTLGTSLTAIILSQKGSFLREDRLQGRRHKKPVFFSS